MQEEKSNESWPFEEIQAPKVATKSFVPEDYRPVPKKRNNIIVLVLIIILLVGTVGFAYWQKWFTLDQLKNTFKKQEKVVAPVDQPKVNDDQRKKDLSIIKNALLKYKKDKGKFPVAETIQQTNDEKNILQLELVSDYLKELPKDPLAPRAYYGYLSDGQTFELTAKLEVASDVSGIQIGETNIYKVSDSSIEQTNSK